jgi:DNA-binding GntR family transcriptional regulator
MKLVRPPTLTASTVDAIRDSIYRGELQPGEPLREVDLCESLQVSRGTVREALRELQNEGLVEVIPHRGAFVPRLSQRTAKEVHTLRALIEPYAVRLALENDAYAEEDLKAIEALARRLHRLEQERGDTYETVQADVEFHHLICRPSNHELLLDILGQLQSLTWLLVFNVHYYKSHEYSDEPSHVEIAEAIRSGDPNLASDTLKHHIDAAGKSLLLCMEELSSGEATDS